MPLPAWLLSEVLHCGRAVFDQEEEEVEEVEEELWQLRLAVRSSALGEDGLDQSSAGQNETLLGLRGEAEPRPALTTDRFSGRDEL